MHAWACPIKKLFSFLSFLDILSQVKNKKKCLWGYWSLISNVSIAVNFNINEHGWSHPITKYFQFRCLRCLTGCNQAKSFLEIFWHKHSLTCRNSHHMCSIKKSILRNFAKFTGKHLCQSLFFNKVAGLRTPSLQNTPGRLLLHLIEIKEKKERFKPFSLICHGLAII